jgi:hypothetical protein
VAAAAAGRRFPVCIPRWTVAEAQLGRRSEERLGAGGDWRGADRLSADARGQCHQHQRRPAIRKGAHHARSSPHFPHQPFQWVVGLDAAPVFRRHRVIAERLVHPRGHDLRSPRQLHRPQLFYYQCSLFPCCLCVFLGVRSLPRCPHLPPVFSRFHWIGRRAVKSRILLTNAKCFSLLPSTNEPPCRDRIRVATYRIGCLSFRAPRSPGTKPTSADSRMSCPCGSPWAFHAVSGTRRIALCKAQLIRALTARPMNPRSHCCRFSSRSHRINSRSWPGESPRQ